MSELAKALVEAQQEMPEVEKTASAVYGKYATLDSLIAKTRPVLNKHGLSIQQFPHVGEHGMVLRTILRHTSGEETVGDTPLLLQKNDMQGLGAAITYARRYAWGAALGIASEHDDDAQSIVAGNGGGTTAQPVTQRPVQQKTTESAAAPSTPDTSFSPPAGAMGQEAQDVRNRDAAGRVRKLFGAEKYKGKTIAEIAELERGTEHLEWVASDAFEPKQDAQKHFKQACQVWLGMEPLVVESEFSDIDIPF